MAALQYWTTFVDLYEPRQKYWRHRTNSREHAAAHFERLSVFADRRRGRRGDCQIKKRLLKLFEIVEERNRISRTFGEYVSPIVMKKLLTLKPDLRSEKRKCV